MDQPTAEDALRALEPLVGEWTFEASLADGEAVARWWDGDVRVAPLGCAPGPARHRRAPGGA